MNATLERDAVDAHLDATVILQLTWKPSVLRNVACRIVRAMLDGGQFSSGLWPDQVDISDVGDDDRNTIGSAYRLLTKAAIIEPTADFRRSKAKGARGRKVFKYVLGRRSRAETFLRRPSAARKFFTIWTFSCVLIYFLLFVFLCFLG